VECYNDRFSSAATVTLTWDFDVPDNLIGTGACLDSFNRIKSGSVTGTYENYNPFEFPSNRPIWGGVAGDISFELVYDCPTQMWSFAIGDASGLAGYAQQEIARGNGVWSG
jgi:hypothetical protein